VNPRTRFGALIALAALVVLMILMSATSGAAAQGGGKPARGNPTPGTKQPDPPNLADRITLNGCVQPAPSRSGTVDPNTPSSGRFVLTSAERQKAVPAGTGGSDLTAKVSGRIYRLEGLESQLSPFVGAKVEVSGEVKLPTSESNGGRESSAPVLLVEFVRKIAVTCP
jgi:hypothetical protein